MRSAIRKAARWALVLLSIVAVTLTLFGLALWSGREERALHSAALGEQRRYTVYNPAARPAKVILVLDGERLRHGLATAMQARLWAFLRGSSSPVVVAIEGQGTRDTDLRNASSQPAAWRPNIGGRSEKFDQFLIEELIPLVGRPDNQTKLYLFGHSLAGLYTVDFAIRHGIDQRLSGYAAFTPTFSHDLSILDRLPQLCAGSAQVLLTIGLESAREHDLFERARGKVAGTGSCAKHKVTFANHPGMIHQVVMLKGQAQAIRSIVLD